jgi:hypothetical protein
VEGPPLSQALAPALGLWGLAISLGVIFFSISDEPWPGLTNFLPPFSVVEGMGLPFGSVAELLPEEQATLAGILRAWAGLFVVCGFALMVIRGIPGV